MKSLWNKNYSLFAERFPQLAKKFNVEYSSTLEIENAKNGSVTAKENNIMLHSKYNPEKEAEALINTFDEEKSVAIFLSFGLGYAPIAFAKKYPDSTIIIFESDSKRFFSALKVLDWENVFNHKKIILALEASLDDVSSLLANYSTNQIHAFKTKPQTAHAEEYFNSVEKIILQNKSKEDVNTNTLEKFANLWMSNSCRNLNYIQQLDGVQKFSNKAQSIPFVIIAAGPSLSSILPFLAEIKKRAILVCVDTALHACLKHNVEPDFIILADPQYYCSLHLEFLESPSSILITEIAAYPSVFRFNCKEKVLFSSMFPIGQYFENKLCSKGKLAAGGSVTTSAWDFALLCNSKEIFIVGMDLGFPKKETHIRGSRFEENAHSTSTKLRTTEAQSLASLYEASSYFTKDYNDNEILTNKKMDLFAWWFESNCKKIESTQTKTYSLTQESRKINGIKKYSLQDFLLRPTVEKEKKQFFELAQADSSTQTSSAEFKEVKKQFMQNLETLEALAKRGNTLCKKGIQNRLLLPEIYQKLNLLDSQISSSSAKDAAALIFPTERQLKAKADQIPNETQADKNLYSIRYSALIYSELLKSIETYKKFSNFIF